MKVKLVLCHCRCKSNSTTFNSNLKRNNYNVNASVKIILRPKNIICGTLAHVFVSAVGILWNEIINVTDSVSTNVTNTSTSNVSSTVSINSRDKNERYNINCYILHALLLVTILLLIITLTCSHYIQFKTKTLIHYQYKNGKSWNKKVGIKYHMCYYFDDIIKTEDFYFYNILLDKKSYKKYFDLWIFEWFMNDSKLWLVQNLCELCLIKKNGFIIDYNGKYLLLFYPEKDYAIFNRIRCQIRLKSGIAHVDWF